MTASTELAPGGVGTPKPEPKPDLAGERSTGLIVGVIVLTVLPVLLLGYLVYAAIHTHSTWWHLSWVSGGLAVVFYALACLGVTVGYHRFFTHGSFKATSALQLWLAGLAALSVQGSLYHWVADHRRHHAHSEKAGDPHSPWIYIKNGKVVYDNLDTDSPFRFGASLKGVLRGFGHSHFGWLTERDQTNEEKYIPDLLADTNLQRMDRYFGWIVVVSFVAPVALGYLLTMSWQGAASALIWASFMRITFLHHITWSVNSICHMLGDRPFHSRDKSANFWPLAILSAGESWHNLHHADPSCARHGVLRGQIDISARTIWVLEKLGWASSVHWPTKKRIQKLLLAGNDNTMKQRLAKLERRLAAHKLSFEQYSEKCSQLTADMNLRLARRLRWNRIAVTV